MNGPDEKQQIAEVVSQLEQRFPAFSTQEIEIIVAEQVALLDGNPIRDYVPRLVEHGARVVDLSDVDQDVGQGDEREVEAGPVADHPAPADLERVRSILHEVGEAAAMARQSQAVPHGPLRVIAPLAFASHQLARRLPRFVALQLTMPLLTFVADLGDTGSGGHRRTGL